MPSFHTPVKKLLSSSKKDVDAGVPVKTDPPRSQTVALARRSIESRLDAPSETRATLVTPVPKKTTAPPTTVAAPMAAAVSADRRGTAKRQSTPETGCDRQDSPQKESTVYLNRTAEAKACLLKTRLINNSRNLKTEIKLEVIDAAERLFRLIKDAEEGRPYRGRTAEGRKKKDLETVEQTKAELEDTEEKRTKEEDRENLEAELLSSLKDHRKLLRESKEEMERMAEEIKKHREELKETRTYASVDAGPPKSTAEVTKALHSIIITSQNEEETGDQVAEKIRKVVNAKEEGLKIDRIRKAKERKVIMGFRNREEMAKVKEKLRKDGKSLTVADIQNKDPLIIVKDLLTCHNDEEILSAIRAQNNHLLAQLKKEENRMEIRYRRKARNPLMAHVVLQVSPQIWQKFTEAGALHIDIQRVKVEDQSSLVQCSRCLGYGHGRRFCRGSLDACSHCGGPHLRAECPD